MFFLSAVRLCLSDNISNLRNGPKAPAYADATDDKVGTLGRDSHRPGEPFPWRWRPLLLREKPTSRRSQTPDAPYHPSETTLPKLDAV